MKLNELTLKESIDALDKKEITLEEIYKDLDQACQAKNEKLNIYLSINSKALIEAKKASKKPLRGLPIAVKDNFCTKGIVTTASSKVLDGFIPQYESTVTERLKASGGVIYGKTNMDAWAHGSSTETSDYGRTLNPRNSDHLPGGSSGGSAAAIAADFAVAAIGSETAGSIRQPAAWCGAVGFKPTYGRVSRFGVIAMASSTDSPGPIAKTVEDACILLNAFAGPDEKDGTSNKEKAPDFTSFLDQSIKGMKIGVIYQDVKEIKETNQKLLKELEILKELGATVELVQAMDPHQAIGVYTVVQRAEVSSNLARYDGIRYGGDRSNFGDEAKRRIMLGTFTLTKGYADRYYNLAQKVRTLYLNDYKELFKKYDVLVSPTSPSFAKEVGASFSSPMFGELEDMLLEASSITGLPGINVPFYRDEKTNLYLGANFIAPMWREDLVIKVADAFEKNTKWNSWRNK
ncbi:MAG: Glutamyl-tRNA(Gln) amidotransferase subunit A [Candidatus Pacebacteria bacterium GW2011_GWF2_38_9]|nr:MAG: glutamyl-tRNA(Gln) and/or aspartyl-tRNA(Asn) amidotransferase subunit A [candidate division TM6 bacterium GW2011_GWF2_28_16]KKQ08311.1 MAG: Glutamyl-tRNA(Gln) amidotransferase subunit A [Candidatus Pacebacteria bacterium GW2011_GWF1_36_5]KKQ88920.1 MAG: Glutamyl-tRNA(Gln) amidotransferase subunit A [Candidatus Pacebacteria bacterium GW2011_GWF2_38_9]HAZ73096.1 Asp-tRNA(Asn)/Glu-tRNA(Gln) amidotransferase subunit GatA [Candidatus Paceibacterota bacterium]